MTSDHLGAAPPTQLSPEAIKALPQELEYTGEFGSELGCFLPTIFWLHRAGHLLGRTVKSYVGMQPFYFFLGPGQFIEKEGPRVYVRADRRPDYLANRDEHKAQKSPFECWPDYRRQFGDAGPRFAKPLLIVNNKYCDEWKMGPINFLPCELLDRIFQAFGRRYQIVYFREGIVRSPTTFSADQNKSLPFGDADVLAAHPDVILFDDLLRQCQGTTYNELKLQLFAKAHFFMTSQGGGCFFCALFSNSLIVVMHRAGRELRKAYRTGIFRRAAAPPAEILVARSTAQFEQAIQTLAFKPRWIFFGTARRPQPALPTSPYLAARQSDISHKVAKPIEF